MNSKVTLNQDRDGKFFLSIEIPIDPPKGFDPSFEETEGEIFAEAKARMVEAFPESKRAEIEYQARLVAEADEAISKAEAEAERATEKWRDALQEKQSPNQVYELSQAKKAAKEKIRHLEKYGGKSASKYKILRQGAYSELTKIGKSEIKALPYIPGESESALQAVEATVKKHATALVEICKRYAVRNRFIMPFGVLNFDRLATEITDELFAAADEAAQGEGALAGKK